ncbi:MAG: class I SAM-dependent methyltransferase [Proteobacteria bacterium]|nr:MAG: class I SAM-dependent methyltransferase [Pseudomonadota bacterium]
MQIFKINSQKEYRQLITDYAEQLIELKSTEQSLANQLVSKDVIYTDGYSWPVQGDSRFLIDKLYQHQGQINWRERLVCEKTQFNNRIRGSIHVFEELFKPKINDAIYLTEQLSPLYQWLIKKYPKTEGSEFVSASTWQDKIKFKKILFPKKLNHQDLTALSYQPKQFDYVLSFDCFEHIPDYKQAFREIYRVLKPHGKLLFSVPFDPASDDTLVRASINKQGETTFHVEPEYHGNPMSEKGSLSYYTFGWDLLDTLESLGFNQAYALVYWSKKYAYFGDPQLLLCAEK